MLDLSGITRVTKGKTRLFSPENVYGEKGKGGMADLTEAPQAEVAKIGQTWNGPYKCARDLGQKWKVRPFTGVPAESTITLMDSEGPGRITHIWITTGPKRYRDLILRMYWDGEAEPSVECPLGDFFVVLLTNPSKLTLSR